jgi:hypothetical protein
LGALCPDPRSNKVPSTTCDNGFDVALNDITSETAQLDAVKPEVVAAGRAAVFCGDIFGAEGWTADQTNLVAEINNPEIPDLPGT